MIWTQSPGKEIRVRAFARPGMTIVSDIAGAGARQIWHGRRCCGIKKQAPGLRRAPDSLLAPHSSAGGFFMRRLFILAGVAATMLVASFAGAHAQQPMPRVQVGILECRGGASVGFVVGSVTNLGCVLRADGMPEDRYVATIRKVGLDLGITQETALAWGVYAPVARLETGDLSGDYVGAQDSASARFALGGNTSVCRTESSLK